MVVPSFFLDPCVKLAIPRNRLYLHCIAIRANGEDAMTTGAVLLILVATLPWVVWVIAYYIRNSRENGAGEKS